MAAVIPRLHHGILQSFYQGVYHRGQFDEREDQREDQHETATRKQAPFQHPSQAGCRSPPKGTRRQNRHTADASTDGQDGQDKVGSHAER
jgi:hypothetical protein